MDLYRSKSSRHRSDEKRDRDRDEDEDGRRSKRLRSHHRSRSRDRERDRHRSSREHRDKEGDRDREKSRDKEERNGKAREREKDKDRESKGRDHEKDRERDRSRRSRSRSERHRSQEREKSQEIEPKERETKDRDRDRRRHKDKKEDKVEPEADPERDQRTVFAYQIALRATETDVYEFFSRAGKVRDVWIIMDRISRCSRGIGYVEFYDTMSVPMAIALSGQLLLGQPVMVKPFEAEKKLVQSTTAAAGAGGTLGPYSGGARRLYVGNLHANMSEDDLRKVFEAFGTVELVQVPRDETGLCKGFGFVQFARLEDARNVLNRNGQLEIAGHAIKVSAVTDQTEVPEATQQQNTGGLSEVELAKEAALYVTRARDSNQKLQKAALENFRKRIPESNSPIHTFPETLEFLRPHYANLQDILKEMDDSRNHLSDILTVLKLTGEKASYLDIVDWPEVGGKSVYELSMNELKAELRNHKLGEKGNRSEMQLRLALHIRKKENKYFSKLRGKPIPELIDFDLKSELRLRLLRVTGSSDELVLRLAKAVNHGIQITEDEKSLAPSTWEDREEVKGVDYPIAFLDLNFKRGTILEVGIILVDPKTWNFSGFSAIIRQSEKFMKSYVGRPSFPRNMLEPDCKGSAMFSDVHETIFYCLNGRTVIGHNIESCDMPLIRDRCFDLGLSVPVPKEIIDTYKWMEEKTDKKLYPNLKLAELASQFELGEQTHRALEDCFLNIEVFKRVLASQNLLEIIETEKSDNTPKRNRRRLK